MARNVVKEIRQTTRRKFSAEASRGFYVQYLYT